MIPSQETLERLATVLEDYPPTELERVTAQYRYLLEGIGSNPDVKEIVELTNRSKQEKLLRTRIIGQYCYFSRVEATEDGGKPRSYKGRLAIEPDTNHPFIKISGRANGSRFDSEFFSLNRDGMLYQWSVEEADGRQVSIGFAKLSFTEYQSGEDRAVSAMVGKFMTLTISPARSRLYATSAAAAQIVTIAKLLRPHTAMATMCSQRSAEGPANAGHRLCCSEAS